MRDIILIGDSILDNSFWGVGNLNTGEILQKIGQNEGFRVKDHSTEELTCKKTFVSLKRK